MLELTNILQHSSYDAIIESFNDNLIGMQIYKRKDFILAENSTTKIANTSSVQTFIDELSAAYGNIDKFSEDATAQFVNF